MSEYRKYYAKNGFVAYAPKSGLADHFFVYTVPNAAGEPIEVKLEADDKDIGLLARWRRAAVRQKRSLYFCQSFDLANIEALFDQFSQTLDFRQAFGRLVYWRDKIFVGGPPMLYPSGSTAAIETGNIRLMFEGNIPETLDDFSFSLNGTDLILGFGRGTECRLRRVDDAGTVLGEANTRSLTLPLASKREFVAGALGITMDWPANRNDDHALRLVGFVYQAMPEKKPSRIPRLCRTWQTQLGDEVSVAANESCAVCLDPRDAVDSPEWMAGKLNSRFDFGTTVLRSSFFGTKAQRFHLQAMEGGVARLGFLFERIDSGGKVSTIGNVIFHPEGPFKIIRPVKRRSGKANESLAIGEWDLITGAAATEFVDLEKFDGLDFVRGSAFFQEGQESKSASQRDLLVNMDGKVFTSYVRFLDGDQVGGADYHTQPADAPLFESVDAKKEDHLTRRRTPFGKSNKRNKSGDILGLPVFPWAGYKNRDQDLLNKLRALEASHLTLFRQLGVVQSKLLTTKDDPSKAVTRQGLLAEVTPEGYTRLYFGNSDSSNPAQVEFSINLSEDGNLARDIQLALSGSQLFLVFDRPTADTLKIVKPDPELHIRDFGFSLDLIPQTKRLQVDLNQRTVLIVKYFKNKSLRDLLNDPSTWGCQSSLAPDRDTKEILKLFNLGPDHDQPVPTHLKQLLDDRDWQGVVVLNLSIESMPDLIEALRPGMIESQLKVHHYGLNFLPAKQEDVAKTGAPGRLGSAFGLISYERKPNEFPDDPTTNDEEPGTNDQGQGRSYKFVVEKLALEFLNSQISDFQAEVSVSCSHLFWDKGSIGAAKRKGKKTRLVAADTFKLIGSYERRVGADGKTEDVFKLQTDQKYVFSFDQPSFLKELVLSRAQLSVVSSQRDSDRKLTALTARIGIDGELTLREGGVKIPLFTVKAIRLSNFGFQFDFLPTLPENDKGRFKFGLKADGIAADIDFDPPSGVGSILGRLPLKLKGMMVAIGQALDLKKLDFLPIGDFKDPVFHFGFVLELDLGFLGKLAGDLRGLRIPLILGWRGGVAKPNLVFGIQFPSFNGKIDIGIQQFIRLRADEAALQRCPANGDVQALALLLNNAQVVMFGRAWPDFNTTIAILIPVHPSRKVSWAIGAKPGGWLNYIGGGHRIGLDENANTTDALVTKFKNDLPDASKVCDLIKHARPERDGWTLVADFDVGIKVQLAVCDAQGLSGLAVEFPVLGKLDILYRRVNDNLGIFSAEYMLPEALRTIQVGVAAIRLPAFRAEVHTDGGFLLDLGFPWNNDFHRSCQVEVAIFLGAGGCYYGRTSAAADQLLQFDGGYGYSAPDSTVLGEFKALRIGFAARVGIGRSFSIGILSAEASLTLFGGIEGSAAYPKGGGNLLSPSLYALKGFMGLMLDIRAEVDFAIIRARAQLLAYAMVGLELRRVLGKKGGEHYFLSLPTVVFAEVALTVSVSVEISVGCVSITIHLSFSATWRFEETLGSLSAELYNPSKNKLRALSRRKRKSRLATDLWNPHYRFWKNPRDIDLYVTVLPCLATPGDVGEMGSDPRTCGIGQMFLPTLEADNGFADLAKFLIGWVLRPQSTNGIADTEKIRLGEVSMLRTEMKDPDGPFWNGFTAALLASIPQQFNPKLYPVSKDDPFASIPLWPGTVFRYIPPGAKRADALTGNVGLVMKEGRAMDGNEASFSDYAHCLITGLMAEFEQIIVKDGQFVAPPVEDTPHDPERYCEWAAIWNKLQQ